MKTTTWLVWRGFGRPRCSDIPPAPTPMAQRAASPLALDCTDSASRIPLLWPPPARLATLRPEPFRAW